LDMAKLLAFSSQRQGSELGGGRSGVLASPARAASAAK
jgi:hypothetical protein